MKKQIRKVEPERIPTTQADGSVLSVDPSKCFFPAGCPGCSNCDRMVSFK